MCTTPWPCSAPYLSLTACSTSTYVLATVAHQNMTILTIMPPWQHWHIAGLSSLSLDLPPSLITSFSGSESSVSRSTQTTIKAQGGSYHRAGPTIRYTTVRAVLVFAITNTTRNFLILLLPRSFRTQGLSLFVSTF